MVVRGDSLWFRLVPVRRSSWYRQGEVWRGTQDDGMDDWNGEAERGRESRKGVLEGGSLDYYWYYVASHLPQELYSPLYRRSLEVPQCFRCLELQCCMAGYVEGKDKMSPNPPLKAGMKIHKVPHFCACKKYSICR